MHWPVPAIDHYVDAWKGMIDLQKEGLVKSIGVCNFQVHHLQRLIDETGVAPVINQIELHPLMQQRQLHAWNATHKIQTESWSPLAQGGEGVRLRSWIRASGLGRTRTSLAVKCVKKPGGGFAIPGLRVYIKNPGLPGFFIYALRFTGFFTLELPFER